MAPSWSSQGCFGPWAGMLLSPHPFKQGQTSKKMFNVVVALDAAAAIFASIANSYVEEAGGEGCDVDPEAKREAPRR